MLIEALTHYYGIDWLASSLAVLMIYFLGNQNRIGFYFGVAANLTWLVFAVLSASPPIFLSNTLFLFLNLRGIKKWKVSLAVTHPSGI